MAPAASEVSGPQGLGSGAVRAPGSTHGSGSSRESMTAPPEPEEFLGMLDAGAARPRSLPGEPRGPWGLGPVRRSGGRAGAGRRRFDGVGRAIAAFFAWLLPQAGGLEPTDDLPGQERPGRPVLLGTTRGRDPRWRRHLQHGRFLPSRSSRPGGPGHGDAPGRLAPRSADPQPSAAAGVRRAGGRLRTGTAPVSHAVLGSLQRGAAIGHPPPRVRADLPVRCLHRSRGPPRPHWRAAASVDHALWLHRPIALDDWVLVDLVGHVLAGGRGLYTGSVFSIDGTLAATISQEMIYRQTSGPRSPTGDQPDGDRS